MCSTPAARWAWSPACCRRPSATRLEAETRGRIRQGARAVRPRPGGQARATTLADARANAFTPDWTAYTPPKPSFIGTRDLRGLRPGRPRPPHRLDAVLRQLGADRPLSRRSSRTTSSARPPRDLFADAQAMLKRIIDEKWFEARGVVGFWPANADGDDIVVYTDETPHRPSSPASTPCASRWPRPAASPTSRCPTSSRRSGASPTGSAASRSPPATARPRSRKRFKDAGDDYSAILATALADRLAEAFAEALHQQGAHRALGLCARRGLRHRRPDRREVPRHPPGARLSGPARPHREGDAVQAAGRGGGDRHGADRELRHDPAGRRSRASTSPTRRATISASARSSATRSRTTPRRKGWDRRPRPSAGWRRSSTTTRSRPAKRRPSGRAAFRLYYRA